MPTVRSYSYNTAHESGNTNLTCQVNKPTGTAENDVLYAGVTDCRTVDDYSGQPSGWTKIGFSYASSNHWNRIMVYRKVAGASEPTTYQWTGLRESACVGIVAVQQADTTTPESDVQVSSDTSHDTSHITPSVDPVGVAELLLSFVELENTNVIPNPLTPPSGMTEVVDAQTSAYWASLGIAYQQLSSGDVTGQKTWTSVENDSSAGINVAVKAASGSPVTINANLKTFTLTPLQAKVTVTVNAGYGLLTHSAPRAVVEQGLLAQTAIWTATGQTAGLNFGAIVNAATASLTTQTFTVGFDQGLTPSFGQGQLTGLTADVNQQVVISTALSTLTAGPRTFTLGSGVLIDASLRSLNATTLVAGVREDYRLAANFKSVNWQGRQASILQGTFITAGIGQFRFLPIGAPLLDSERIDVKVARFAWQPMRAWLAPVIGDKRLSQALREAYASAPPEVVTLDTIEIWHPNFTGPIRVVRNFENFVAKLESTAPRNAGEQVTFQGYAFEIRLPDSGENTNSELEIIIDNVDQVIVDSIELAMTSEAQIEVIYRPYLSHDTSGPQMIPPIIMYIKQIDVDIFKVKAICDFGEVINRRFPYAEYTLTRFPGLVS